MKRKLVRGILFLAVWLTYGLALALLLLLLGRRLVVWDVPLLIRLISAGGITGVFGVLFVLGGQKLSDYVCTTEPWRRIFSSKAE